jgi:hypothetical protein
MSRTQSRFDIRVEVRNAIASDGQLLIAAQHCAALGLLPTDGKLDSFKADETVMAEFQDEATMQYSADKVLHYIVKSEVDGKIEVTDAKNKAAKTLTAEYCARLADAEYRKVPGSNDDPATLKYHVKRYRDSVKELVQQLYRRMARRLAQEQAKKAGTPRAVKAPKEVIMADLDALAKHAKKNKSCSEVQYALELKKLTDAVTAFMTVVLA